MGLFPNCTKNLINTQNRVMQKDLEENTEFRIKYPRGELGQSAGDSELFMMLEDLYLQRIEEEINSYEKQ